MKKLLKLISLVFVFTWLFYLLSCDDGYQEPSKNELLAGRSDNGKNWKIKLIEVALGSIQPFSCVRDNNITYYPNGRYEVNEGESKCDPLDPPAYLGSWTLSRDKSKLTIAIGDSVKVYDLDYIDERNHRITSQFVDGERTYILEIQ